MMRRLCVGGSRLEDERCAGAAHVIEHMDFRKLDWNDFSGMVKNASTSKLFIQHEAFMLLDPQHNHLQKELRFQKETMLGENLRGLKNSEILHEINNVRDEWAFNSQSGAAYRSVIMRMENKLLPRVWSHGAWSAPTIGTDQGLKNLRSSKDMLRMHRMFRSPERTYMVLAGPVDVNRTLDLLNHHFADIPRQVDNKLLRPIPTSVMPVPMAPAVSVLSLDSGNRAIAIGGVKGAYNKDTDVMLVMQHLVGMLGQQPAVKQHGASEVSLYLSPDEQAGVFSLLAKVDSNGNESQAIVQAKHALEEHVIAPLLSFNDSELLRNLVTQYKQSLKLALVSGPQQAAELAVQGILACGRPSWAWHVNDRFSDDNITAGRVQEVARQMFHPNYMGVVYCTSSTKSPLAQMIAQESHSSLYDVKDVLPNFNLKADISHLAPDIPHTNVCEYVDPKEALVVNTEQVFNQNKDHVGTIAYNTVQMLPLKQRALTCAFGTPTDYGGWAQASLAVAAMNTIARVCNASACKYELSNQQITATVQSMPNSSFEVQPLITSVAMAMAAGGTVDSYEVRELQAALPQAALNLAIEEAKAMYNQPSQLAVAQTRSQVCSALDPGYVPPDLNTATRLLSAEHTFVCQNLRSLYMQKPKLAGTNLSSTNLQQIAVQLSQLSSQVPSIASQIKRQPALTLQNLDHLKNTAVQQVSGLKTYPYVASVRGKQPLCRDDRAALLISNQVVAGGMGAAYNHEIRQRGVSYRPSGLIQLSWQDNPVLILNATFSKQHQEEGQSITQEHMRKWARGASSIFTQHNVEQAKNTIREQLLLTSTSFDAQKYNLLSEMDSARYSGKELLQSVNNMHNEHPRIALKKYFGRHVQLYESWVTC